MEKQNNHFKTTQDLACQGQVKVISEDLLNEILKIGLIVSCSKGCGKSNSLKVIVSELLRLDKTRTDKTVVVKVFDSALNWLFDFSELQHQLIGDKSTLYNVDNCIYDTTWIDDPDEIDALMREVIAVDFHNHARNAV